MALPSLLLAALVTAIAAFTDWRSGRIPNWLTLGAAVLGLCLRLVPALAARDFWQALSVLLVALLGLSICSVIPLLLFWKGGMGGGDVKLFAALGVLCSPEVGLLAQTYTFMVALVLAPAWLLYRGTLVRTLKQAFVLATNPLRPRSKRRELPVEELAWFRLGPAIFLGTLLAVSRAVLFS